MPTPPIEFLPTPANAPLLDADTIHVWIHRLAEARHGAALRSESRDVLGRLLCLYAGLVAPPEIALGTHGKPFAPALPSLDFNLSHSGNCLTLAFARGQPIGIDIETIDRRVSIDEIAARFFSADEAQRLSKLPEALRRRAFIALWTHKEAVLKANGQGLGFGLDRVVFDVGVDGAIGALKTIGDDTIAEWRVCALDIDARFCAAIGWRGPSRRVRVFSG